MRSAPSIDSRPSSRRSTIRAASQHTARPPHVDGGVVVLETCATSTGRPAAPPRTSEPRRQTACSSRPSAAQRPRRPLARPRMPCAPLCRDKEQCLWGEVASPSTPRARPTRRPGTASVCSTTTAGSPNSNSPSPPPGSPHASTPSVPPLSPGSLPERSRWLRTRTFAPRHLRGSRPRPQLPRRGPQGHVGRGSRPTPPFGQISTSSRASRRGAKSTSLAP